MADRRHQVIIVGAGPAGAVTGLLLARRGVDVVLLDRDTFPRPKPCGECLSAEATTVLDRLGLLDRVLAEAPAELTGWRVVSPSGGSLQGRFVSSDGQERKALALDRRRLDFVLVREALRAGASLERVRVRDVWREDGRVRGVVGLDEGGSPVRVAGSWVVGADGLRSVVSRRLGLVRRRAPRTPGMGKVSLTAHGSVVGRHADWDPSLGEMHLKADACVGVAPVDAGAERFNLTLVVSGGAKPPGGRLGDFFLGHLRAFPALAGRVSSLRLEDGFLASGPFDVPTRSTVVNGAALVGDAAGYFDPFTGQGVFRAMAGAEILAPPLAEAVDAGRTDAGALRDYARGLHDLVAWPRRLQRVIDVVVTRPWLADPVISRLGKAPAVSDTLVSVTGDLRPVRALASFPLLKELLHPPITREKRP